MNRIKMYLLGLFLVFSFFGISHAIAGSDVGNGGHSVVCQSPSGPTAVLYDYWEGSNILGFTPVLGAKELSVQEKTEIVIRRIERFDRPRAERYREVVRLFFVGDNVKFVTTPLKFISDMGPTPSEPGCELKQLAIRRFGVLPGEPTFLVHQETWDLLDNDSRAGLVLHEVIYKEATDFHHHYNSHFARYFHEFMASQKGERLDAQTYLKVTDAALLTNTRSLYKYQVNVSSKGRSILAPDVELSLANAINYCSQHGFSLIKGGIGTNYDTAYLVATYAEMRVRFQKGELYWMDKISSSCKELKEFVGLDPEETNYIKFVDVSFVPDDNEPHRFYCEKIEELDLSKLKPIRSSVNYRTDYWF
ncbi:MAG: hypothetical protein HY537_16150 [Deltaproteobacteria bacterium]|nr:hypothetical protein [Deltaproteobacteria bacterium]